ncbi:hypothetical protein RYZ20_02835 [Thioclava sp. A2]|uniref:hypothetical protein n=1 Tax=Thioclava sp. FCG-A2 TaxID=3080562 RepID=UPI0029550092|nr:hypothetical protein [Thioclava sp. A2]MDV7269829.1 hypothetical protein [Thioclava sp. A2]
MFRRFFNQWPRFLFGWITLTLSLFGYILAFDLVEFFLIAPSSFVMIAITSAVLVGLPMLFLTLFIPRFLTMIEVVSLTLLLTAPVTYVVHQAMLPDFIVTVIAIAILWLLESILYGPLSRFAPKVKYGPCKARIHTRLTPEEVWKRVVPDPQTVRQYYQPGAMTMPAPAGTDAEFILCIPRRWGYPDTSSLVRRTEITPNRRIRIEKRPVHADKTNIPEIIEYRIEPAPYGSDLSVIVRYENIPVGYWLFLNFYSMPRDLAMCLRARLNGTRDWSLLGTQIRKQERPATAAPLPA